MRSYGHRSAWYGLALLGGIGCATSALLAGEFTTNDGKTVETPDIITLTCAEMEVTLAHIDDTRYRENSPVPRHDNDKPLHAYEKKLARAHYNSCVLAISRAIKDTEQQK